MDEIGSSLSNFLDGILKAVSSLPIIDNLLGFVGGVADGASDLISIIKDGVLNVLDVVVGFSESIASLYFIFPIEVQAMISTFFTIVFAYLLYKILRGG